MSKIFTGTFQILKWDEECHLVFEEGGKHCCAQIKQTYSGDITGDSSLKYLMNYKTETSAVFVGFEVIDATIGDIKGRLVLRHDGIFEQGVASSKFKIISENCTENFKGINGSGSFVSTENGQADYQFEIDFDENTVKVIGI